MSSSPNSSSLPFGYACLAIAVLALSYTFYNYADAASTVPTIFFVGGLGLLIAAFVAFNRGDAFNATWMGGYSVMFFSSGLYLWQFAAKSMAASTETAWWAIAWGVFTALVFLVSLKTKRTIASLTLLLFFITFLCAWIANAFGAASFNQVAAIASLITAVLAAIEGYTQLAKTV